MSNSTIRIVAISAFMLILGVGTTTAQVEIPSVKADSVTHDPVHVKDDFEEPVPPDEFQKARSAMPRVNYEGHPEDTTDSGYLVKINARTGERTVIRHEVPDELPEAAQSESFEGVLSALKTSAERPQKFEDDKSGTQNFSSYQLVNNPTSERNRKFVKIKMWYPSPPNPNPYGCSGTLIDEEWVLTAAHCVQQSDSGGLIDSAKVFPGYDNGTESYGRATSINFFVFQGWDGDNNWGSDMALIQLDRPVGVLTGYHSYGYKSSGSFYTDANFYNKSYPIEGSSFDGDDMYKMSGDWDFFPNTKVVDATSSNLLGFNGAIAVGGSSGSSTYATKNGLKAYTVSSHTKTKLNGDRRSPSYHTRITGTKYNRIQNAISNSRFSQKDLVALDAEVSSKRIVEGQELDRVEFLIFNKGTGFNSDQPYNIEIYLSDNKDISRNDTKIDSITTNIQFDGRETYRVWQEDVKIPIGQTGTKYIGFIIDENDRNTSDNDTDGWDAQKITVESATTIQFTSELTDGSDYTGAYVDVSKWDLEDNYGGRTDISFKYAAGTDLYFDTGEYSDVYEFVRWERNGSTYSNDEGASHTVSNNTTFKAIFKLPAVPVKPHQIRARLPEKHTESDATETFKIVNKHDSRIDWSISEQSGSGWLSVSPSSGTTYPNSTSTITVTMSSDYLSKGGYRDHLVISDGNGNSSKVQVDLGVGPPPGTAPTPEEVHKAIFIAELMENLGFGMGLDIDGTPDERFMGVGASGPTTQPGHVFTKRMVDGKWSEFTEVTSEQRIQGDQFGAAVDVVATGNNPFLVAGAPGLGPDKPKATVQQAYSGRVDLFRHNGDGWIQSFSLPLGEELADGAQFGASVAAHPDPNVEGQQFIAIGAPNGVNGSGERTGKVFVYKYILGDLAGHSVITPEEAVPNDFFGKSVELVSTGNNPFLVVGAPGQEGSKQTGRAYIYRYNGESWYHYQTITPEKAQAGDLVGSAVATSSSEAEPLIALGAPGADLTSENSGGIFTYRYTLETESWQPVSVIQPKIEVPNPQFGQTLMMHKAEGSTILMAGAPATGNAEYGGEAQIYRKVDGDDEWLFRSRLRPETKDGDADVGQSLAMAPINGKLRFFAGAPGTDVEDTPGVGQVYQFELQNPITLPQLTLEQEMIRQELAQEEQAQQQLHINSTGKAALMWNLDTGNTPWLSVETDSGTIQAGSSRSINLNFNATELDTGLYSADIVLETNDANRDCTYIAVEMHVTDTPTGDLMLSDMLVEAPDSIEIGNMLGQEVNAYLFNEGTDPIDSTITVGLFASSDDVLDEQDSLFASTRIDTGLASFEGTMVRMPKGALVPGNQSPGTAYFIMAADYGNEIPELSEENNQNMREVTLIEAPLPKFESLAGIEEGLHFSLEQGKTTEQTIEFENTGRDSLFYSVLWFAPEGGLAVNAPASTTADTAAPPYLVGATPAAGDVAPGETGTIVLDFNAEGVETGSYQDTLSIITNDPERIAVLVPMDVTIEEGTAIEDEQPLPDDFALRQNYPNPFNPATEIRYELPKSAEVTLSVYNMLGRRIATLIDGRQSAGRHSVTFEAGELPSGAYIYRIEAGGFTETRKMMLLK